MLSMIALGIWWGDILTPSSASATTPAAPKLVTGGRAADPPADWIAPDPPKKSSRPAEPFSVVTGAGAAGAAKSVKPSAGPEPAPCNCEAAHVQRHRSQ